PGASLGIVEVDPETTDADSALHATDSHVITNQKDVNTPQECGAECATKGVFCLCFFS
ncbi:hypothetical protein ACUOA5_09650, partial [Escherichia coli]